MKRAYAGVTRLVASPRFFWAVLLFFFLQALYVAITFRYPMLWDEYYHYGLIRFYTDHVGPIINAQPESLDIYGNVERSPKYLYHYLMSYPLGFFQLFTANEMLQIILLRILNIGLFIAGLIAYRYAFLRLAGSHVVANLTTLIITLLPLSSLLAGQINYDNMQFTLIGIVFLLAVLIIQGHARSIILFLLAGGVTAVAALVKYTSLPVTAPIIILLAIVLVQRHGRGLPREMFTQLGRLSKLSLLVLGVFLVISLGLFSSRFIGNVVMYGTIEPRCNRVLTIERCLNFSPFKQEFTDAQVNNVRDFEEWGVLEPVAYTIGEWIPESVKQYFISGSQVGYERFETAEPLPIPYLTAIVGLVIAVVAGILYAIKRWKSLLRPAALLLILPTVVILVSLWLNNYEKYTRTGYPLAIQGRYLVPVLPSIIFGGIVSVRNTLAKHTQAQPILAAIIILSLLAGGGVITHIISVQDSWLWV